MGTRSLWIVTCLLFVGAGASACAGNDAAPGNDPFAPLDASSPIMSPGAAGTQPASGGTAAGMGGSAGSAGTGSMKDAGTLKDAATPRDAAPPADAATSRDSGRQDASSTPADAGSGTDEPDATRAGWKLTFREEFDGPEGAGIDTANWTPVNKGDGFGNNELQFYTPRKENVRMDGAGSLIIEARKESYMGRMYTSARLESSGKFEQQYGRFEIRAKLPFGQGIWPAFWTLGNDISSVSWPQCGEIDIMEHVGKQPSTAHGSLHGPGYSGGNPLTAQYQLPGGARFADDFHEFAVEWEKDVVRFYVDEHLYETRTPADVPGDNEWVYDHPFFMILNLAIGGAFPGSPDDTTQFPQRLLVDYIRVYERE